MRKDIKFELNRTVLTDGVTQLAQNSRCQRESSQQVELLPVRIGVQAVALVEAGQAGEEERDSRNDGDDDDGRGQSEHLEVDEQVDIL